MAIIAHLDMDAFFAAVEERDKPRLRGKAVVVGGDPNGGHGRGIVSTANYAARVYGIRSAMSITKAWQLAEEGEKNGGPHVVFVEPDFHRYGTASRNIFNLLRTRVSLVEQTSVDEAYFDLSFCKTYEAAERLARELKKEILEKENLTCSVGIAPNKFIAKIASDFKKPDGLTLVRDEAKDEFLEPLALRKLPGIGPKTEELFLEKGFKTVKDAKRYTLQELEDMLGKWGTSLYHKLRGEGGTQLITEPEDAKSVGEQETFYKDTLDAPYITERLQELARDVFRRFTNDGFSTYRRIVFTVRFADFETKTKSETLKAPHNDFQTIEFEAVRMLMPFLDTRANPRKKLIRLVGVRVEQLV